jgi:hypothetical protein
MEEITIPTEKVTEEQFMANTAASMHRRIDEMLASPHAGKFIDQFYDLCHDFEG